MKIKFLNYIVFTLILIFTFSIQSVSQNNNENQNNIENENQTEEKEEKEINILEGINEIENPNQKLIKMRLEGKERNSLFVIKEKKLAVKCCDAIIEFANEFGIAETIGEVNRGLNGAFWNYYPRNSYIYLYLIKYDGTVLKFIGSGNGMYRGLEIEPSNIMDLTEWSYIKEFLDSGNGKSFLNDILFADPQWAKGNVCRMSAFYKNFSINDTNYILAYSLFLDK